MDYGTNIATAIINGGLENPSIYGTVIFRPMGEGTLVSANIYGLPPMYGNSFHGFHLHENGICDITKDFSDAGGHYNPTGEAHGMHAGDFPSLLSCNGFAKLEFYTNRFRPSDILGRSVIIHENPDDFRTDPAGNSGKRIACGIARKA